MREKERVLSPSAARKYYDRFGKKQDSQGFYEDPALDDLIVNADFHNSRSVSEFGCGTGKFAARLLEERLCSTATYRGQDISPVMVELAKRRLETYGRRAQVALSDGTVRFPCSDNSVDRVVSTYVLDLLSEEHTRLFFSEASRVLVQGGKLCLASLTNGSSLPSRIVSSLWMFVFRLNPAIVGGCRPINLDCFVNVHEWQVIHQNIVTPYGVPSEVLILQSKGASGHLESP